MGFKSPLFLFLLFLVIPLIYRLYFKIKFDAVMCYPLQNGLSTVIGSGGRLRWGLIVTLYVLSYTFIVISLAGPRTGKMFEKRLSEGVDIMIALDVSGSMRSVDDKVAVRAANRRGVYYDPSNSLTNRLEYAKKFTEDFIWKRIDDRVGFVVFAGYCYTKCPLTFDKLLLVRILREIDFKDVDVQSTAIGMAIANGVNRLLDSKAKSRILILITDGVNNAGNIAPITAAKVAQAMGVKVYTIGFGSNNPVMPSNRKGYFVPSRTTIDEGVLKKIAKLTGGLYFRATAGERLSEIYDKIDDLEKSVIEKQVFVEYEELYQIFLFIGMFLLLVAHLFRYVVFKVGPGELS